uniref:Uncharacterized protein n=1 Tax=Arundo donax TaxID=35708 RepID=A0A0A9BN65_ARUDO
MYVILICWLPFAPSASEIIGAFCCLVFIYLTASLHVFCPYLSSFNDEESA